MEPRATIGDYNAATGCYTLLSGSGRVAKLRLDPRAVGERPAR
jgi:hypothetical protein